MTTERARRAELPTRERLLTVAAQLFAERGFAEVTVRQICEEARANLAAVNYHFGDKLALYRQVVEDAIERRRGSPGGVRDERADPEERIREYVRVFVSQVLAPSDDVTSLMRIMRHEMHEPTALAPWIAEQTILPRIRYLAAAVSEILGCDPEDPRVRRSVMSLQAQCVFHLPHEFRRAAFPDWPEMTDAEIRATVEHIVSFSLAGIRNLAPTARPAVD